MIVVLLVYELRLCCLELWHLGDGGYSSTQQSLLLFIIELVDIFPQSGRECVKQVMNKKSSE